MDPMGIGKYISYTDGVDLPFCPREVLASSEPAAMYLPFGETSQHRLGGKGSDLSSVFNAEKQAMNANPINKEG